MFLKILFISVILLSAAMLGMALNILVRKKGKFPAYQVGHNRDMHKLGITCVKHDEIKCFKASLNSTSTQGSDSELKELDEACEGCQKLM